MKLKSILFFSLLMLLFTGFLFCVPPEEPGAGKDSFNPEGAETLNSMGMGRALKSEGADTLNSEGKDFLNSEGKDSQNSEEKDFLNSEGKDSQSSEEKDSQSSEEKDSLSSEEKDSLNSEEKDSQSSEEKDSQSSEEEDSLSSEEKDSLSSEEKDSLNSKEADTLNSKEAETLNSDVPEPGGINLEASGGWSPQVTEKQLGSSSSSRNYTWNYGDYEWHLTMRLDEELYQIYKERTRKRDYDLFASDPYDDRLIQNIAETLTNLTWQYELKEEEIPGLCTSFVQSLNYTSDLVSAGYDQYPRFPYETLYENGGDCEDTSILSAAILQEMGYEVVLFELPEHMAIGIKSDSSFSGKSFSYMESPYYYLETTGTEWNIGEIPDEYLNQSVKVIPIFKRPFIDLDFKGVCECDKAGGIVEVNVTMKNVGSETAEDTAIYVALQSREGGTVWDEIESRPMQVEPEESYYYTAEGLFVPDGEAFRIYVQAFGENVISEGMMSDWVFLLAGVAGAEFF